MANPGMTYRWAVANATAFCPSSDPTCTLPGAGTTTCDAVGCRNVVHVLAPDPAWSARDDCGERGEPRGRLVAGGDNHRGRAAVTAPRGGPAICARAAVPCREMGRRFRGPDHGRARRSRDSRRLPRCGERVHR